jgi:hypothetical protein
VLSEDDIVDALQAVTFGHIALNDTRGSLFPLAKKRDPQEEKMISAADGTWAVASVHRAKRHERAVLAESV